MSGTNMVWAIIGFLVTAVILPVVGLIVVGKFGGLNELASKVGKIFSLIFTILIYICLGPGIAIPRAGSVPYEMSVAPYMPEGTSNMWWMLLYTFIFFLIVIWMCLYPGKLVKIIGAILTPALLILVVSMFIAFLFKCEKIVAAPSENYQNMSFLQGFIEGYQTMDTLASLNFGLVISLTLRSYGVEDDKGIVKNTIYTGIISGSILAAVYLMLSLMGALSSGYYPSASNGAEILRLLAYDLFGDFGAILIAAIFALACLTTCVGLVNSISEFFADLVKKIPYKIWVIIVAVISLVICNFGLNVILQFSVPILNALYPVAIVLILLGLFDRFYKNNRFVYKLCIFATFIISTIFAIDGVFDLGGFSTFLSYIPLYKEGFAWVIFAPIMFVIGILLELIFKKKKDNKNSNEVNE
jgi:LIVCS family branched-chain amino acid:cation transporter